MSASVATFVTASNVSSAIVKFVGVITNTGAAFTSNTTTSNSLVVLASPSLTTVVNRFVLSPCSSPGVHVITPFVIAALVTTPPPRFVTVSV